MKIIEISCCKVCPYFYRKDSYGVMYSYRCSQLLGGDNYKPFDECIEPSTIHLKVDDKCPLKDTPSNKIRVVCTICNGTGSDKFRIAYKCDGCDGIGSVEKESNI
jgi:hypothetical protein